ncbi:MAG: DNA topoisomerase IV subunit A [Planctomycetota bacterium]
MAKKTTKKPTKASPRRGSPAKSSVAERDARTVAAIRTLAAEVVDASLGGREPSIDIPTRTLSNTRWDKKSKILRMGDATTDRHLFNLGQARKFMQTLLHAKGVNELLDRGKSSSLRGLFYAGLHTIKDFDGKDTKEKTFDDQSESDGILEDLEVMLGSLREELHLYAENRGAMVGNITITDRGDEINCRRMGSGGYAIPSIVEPDVIEFSKIDAKFVLHVEKGTVWQRFNEDRFWEQHNCILTHGGGQPSRGVRRLLQRFSNEAKLPVICLLDCDPWGHYIYSVIKQGSISLAFESERLAVPTAKFLGIRAKDHKALDLSDDVKIALNDKDTNRAKQIAAYPWFAEHKGWQREINGLLKNGFKMEVEALISKDISYVTETYVPERLAAEDWLA